MQRRLGFLVSAFLVVALAAGCGGSDAGASCVADGKAEVCATSEGGQILIDASGLKPGSELRLDAPQLEPGVWKVDASGSPAGQVIVVRRDASQPVDITVEATGANGETISDTLTA